MSEAELIDLGFTQIKEVYDHDANLLKSSVKPFHMKNNPSCEKRPGTYDMEQRFVC